MTTIPTTEHPIPTEEEIVELLLCCRYGELEEVKEFVGKFGSEVVSKARDERGNTILHMCCGNGHVGMYFLYVRVSCLQYLIFVLDAHGSQFLQIS